MASGGEPGVERAHQCLQFAAEAGEEGLHLGRRPGFAQGHLEILGDGLEPEGPEGAGQPLDGMGPARRGGPVVRGEGLGDHVGCGALGRREIAQQGNVELGVAFHAAQADRHVEAVDRVRKARGRDGRCLAWPGG